MLKAEVCISPCIVCMWHVAVCADRVRHRVDMSCEVRWYIVAFRVFVIALDKAVQWSCLGIDSAAPS
jgi:hypothetical protein